MAPDWQLIMGAMLTAPPVVFPQNVSLNTTSSYMTKVCNLSHTESKPILACIKIKLKCFKTHYRFYCQIVICLKNILHMNPFK